MGNILYRIGDWSLERLRAIGDMALFLCVTVYYVFVPPFKYRVLLRQIKFIGYRSLLVIVLTGAFAGMVLALQVFYTLRKFGSEALLGPAVALSLVRELGPVLSALMITGRAGSAIAAEIGIMRITEQIDALTAMALNPIRYLVVPNLVAAIIVFPLASAIFDIVGIFGGYVVGVKLLGLGEGTYFSQIEGYMEMADIMTGVYKSLSFGVIVAWVCCYKGFNSTYGARGVSKATTEAVVVSSVMVLVWDYFLGTMLM